MAGVSKGNFMAMVFCPKGRAEFWANSTTKEDGFRCCKCGEGHSKSKGSGAALLLDSSPKSSKKKYKKGKKQK